MVQGEGCRVYQLGDVGELRDDVLAVKEHGHNRPIGRLRVLRTVPANKNRCVNHHGKPVTPFDDLTATVGSQGGYFLVSEEPLHLPLCVLSVPRTVSARLLFG